MKTKWEKGPPGLALLTRWGWQGELITLGLNQRQDSESHQDRLPGQVTEITE